MGLNGETMWGVKSLRIFLNVRIIFLYKKRQLLIYSYLTLFHSCNNLLAGWNVKSTIKSIQIPLFIVINYFIGFLLFGFGKFYKVSIFIKMF